MATKIRGRQIETGDFIRSLGNSNVDWANDSDTASQLAIASLVSERTPGETVRFYGNPTGTAAVTTSGHRTSAIWDITDPSVTDLYDGMRITVRVPVAGSSSYWTVIRFNNGDMHPVVFAVNSNISTRYAVGAFVEATYDAQQTATYYNDSNTARTATGVWKVMDYDSNTTTTYGTIDYYFRPFAGAEALYRYKLVALGADNRLVPITVTDQTSTAQVAKTPSQVPFRPGKIWLYNSTATVGAGAQIGGQTMLRVGYHSSGCQYNFNATVPANRLIFLRGSYDKDTDLFTLTKDSSSPCTSYYTLVPTSSASLTLSDYFTEGGWYILVGGTYSSANYLQLFEQNTLHYFDGTNLIPAQTALNPTATSDLTNDSGFITAADVTSDRHFSHEWVTPTTQITITHNLGKHPSVTVIDTGGNEFVCAVEHIDNSSVTLTFSQAIRGTAYFN